MPDIKPIVTIKQEPVLLEFQRLDMCAAAVPAEVVATPVVIPWVKIEGANSRPVHIVSGPTPEDMLWAMWQSIWKHATDTAGVAVLH